MKNKLFFLLCVPLSLFSQVFIRNGLSGGRFGDNLLSYMHAKYISYKYDLPLIYEKFIYSDQLVLDDKEPKNCTAKIVKLDPSNFDSICSSLESGSLTKSGFDIVLEIPYFPEDKKEHIPHSGYIFFDVSWKDQKFKNILKELIVPKKELTLITPPTDKISVALHLRLGGDYSDDRCNRYKIPLKLPPLKFFVKSLKKIINMFNSDQKFYVFIFTDETDTRYYLDYFRQKFPQENITFDCRLEGNSHDQNVLEDFFSMVQFDCSVHPLSNYSIAAAKIADYLVEIEPVDYAKKNNKFVITKDRVIISDTLKTLNSMSLS